MVRVSRFQEHFAVPTVAWELPSSLTQATTTTPSANEEFADAFHSCRSHLSHIRKQAKALQPSFVNRSSPTRRSCQPTIESADLNTTKQSTSGKRPSQTSVESPYPRFFGKLKRFLSRSGQQQPKNTLNEKPVSTKGISLPLGAGWADVNFQLITTPATSISTFSFTAQVFRFTKQEKAAPSHHAFVGPRFPSPTPPNWSCDVEYLIKELRKDIELKDNRKGNRKQSPEILPSIPERFLDAFPTDSSSTT